MVRMAPSVAGLLSASAVALSLSVACTNAEAIENIPAGTEVTVVTQDGTLVRGKLAKVGTGCGDARRRAARMRPPRFRAAALPR